MKEKNAFKKDLTWEQKANENPLFAIMSDKIFENKSKEFDDSDLKAFYKRGELLWKKYFSDLINEDNIPLDKIILEFGCGMGRLLSNPAVIGYKCIGLDISETQLSLAKVHFPVKSNIKFIKIDSKRQFELASGSVDVIYSYAVFQHIKYLSDFYFSLNELIRILNKGGLIRIQFRASNVYSARFKATGFRSFNFEKLSVIFYWKMFFGLPIPVLRFNKHNHWGGAGCYVSEKSLIKFFEKNGVKIKTIQFDIEGQDMVWLTGQK